MSELVSKLKQNKLVKNVFKLGAVYLALEVVLALGVVFWAVNGA